MFANMSRRKSESLPDELAKELGEHHEETNWLISVFLGGVTRTGRPRAAAYGRRLLRDEM
jgi:hypothetical protein